MTLNKDTIHAALRVQLAKLDGKAAVETLDVEALAVGLDATLNPRA